ncbi:Oidioi.mRNA.OKI2018_I69.XSR.g14289.t1.cds [Oikopleura dioica]|uniref:Oidioi.mRNA.OKI2018_I69.XSR.g14289.t1.cds n=1 Tax=Oikopleura dioica TaxID=34765 RepID=A0ABN7S9C3_OIKDI|nr:Oidioi.mRNA.OKI2018_I69.XSR.g14289.t1.cds [Oikopleura dioica]
MLPTIDNDASRETPFKKKKVHKENSSRDSKMNSSEGLRLCFLTLLVFVASSMVLTVGMVSLTGLLGSSQKKSFRRSLAPDNHNYSTQIDGKIKRIDLGSVASGGYEGKLHFRPTKQKEINIGYILCLNGGSNRDFLLEQFIASAKSVLAFSNRKVNFRIATNDVEQVTDQVQQIFPQDAPFEISFDIREDLTRKEMDILKDVLKFKGCGHLKVTFHQTFSDLDKVLLIDADTIFLRPAEELFDIFDDFGSEAAVGMAEEHPWNEKGYYSHRPYAHNKLLKSDYRTPVSEDSNNSFEKALLESISFHLLPRVHYLADQCAMNALFSENKEKMAILPCEWNLRSWGLNTCTKDDCYCSALSEPRTCALLHGQGSQFTAQANHIGFYTVWKTIFDFSWNELSNRNLLLTSIRRNLLNVSDEDKKADQSGIEILQKCI